MEAIDILKHLSKLSAIAEMIIVETHRFEQIDKLRKEKNFSSYSEGKMMKEIYRYEHKITIHKMALERLKQYYINNSKLN